MSRFQERKRGVTVQVLDLSQLEASALTYRKLREPACTKVNTYGGQWALAHNGELVLAICTEGVAYELTEEEGMEFQYHGNYKTYDDSNVTKFDFMPFASIELSLEEMLEIPVKEEVDLADFVRVFGDRLENNFWTLYNELS